MKLPINLNSKKRNRCCGCMACENICPKSCITIISDNKGNFFRNIDKNKCVDCNQCENVCPILKCNVLYTPKKAYIAWSKKINVNRKSTSGGIAASVYEYCIKKNISCIGVKFNKQLKVQYSFVDSFESIKNFIGSKYVFSHMNGIYKQVVEKLEQGETIVFIGLPCHVAALRNVVKKNHNKLFCIDLVCHGIVSEKYLEEHLNHMAKNIKKKNIASINFREEKNPYGITIKGKNGEILKQQTKIQDEYMLGFCDGFIFCEECYKCSYARKERCSDLTIKDFCGIRKGILLKQKYGLSSILVNTSKGECLMKELGTYLNIIEDSVEDVIAKDAMLRMPAPKGKRKLFVKLYPLLGFDQTVRILCFRTILKDTIQRKIHVIMGG